RRRHTSFSRDWSSDVCSSDLVTFNDNLAIGGFIKHTRQAVKAALRTGLQVRLIGGKKCIAQGINRAPLRLLLFHVSQLLLQPLRSEERRVNKCTERRSVAPLE